MLLIPCNAFATETTFQDADDSYIYKDAGGSDADTNYGTATEMKVTGHTDYWRRPILKFDVSSIDSGDTVSSAILYVYFHTDLGYSFDIGAYRVFKTWTEAGVTWNDWINPDSEWGTAGCDSTNDSGSDNSGDGTGDDRKATAEDTYSFTANDGAGWHDFDITSLVQGWVDGSMASNGVILISDANSNIDSVGYYSEDYTTDTSKQPKLVVTHTSGAGTTTASVVRVMIE